MQSNADFVKHFINPRPEKAKAVVAGFKGDPKAPKAPGWKVFTPIIEMPSGKTRWSGPVGPTSAPRLNTYMGVSSFYPIDDPKKGVGYYRRKAGFAALHALMLDDLGTGPGAKMPMSAAPCDYTALIETSPDNYQAWIKLDPPLEDQEKATRLINAMISQGLLQPADPGMRGVARLGRMPNGINGKEKYLDDEGNPWQVRLDAWHPSISYSAEELIEELKLNLDQVEGGGSARRRLNPEQAEAARTAMGESDPYLQVLSDLGLVEDPTAVPWEDTFKVEVTCPWIDEHTDRADTGTAYFVGGGFRCHHGHCKDRTFGTVRRWLALRHGIDVERLDLELQRLRIRRDMAALTAEVSHG